MLNVKQQLISWFRGDFWGICVGNLSPKSSASLQQQWKWKTSLSFRFVCANRSGEISFCCDFYCFSFVQTLLGAGMIWKMFRSRGLLIILSGFLLSFEVRSDDVGYHDLFLKLNDEILSVNHQTAKLAWETRWDCCNDRKKPLGLKLIFNQFWSAKSRKLAKNSGVFKWKTQVEPNEMQRTEKNRSKI